MIESIMMQSIRQFFKRSRRPWGWCGLVLTAFMAGACITTHQNSRAFDRLSLKQRRICPGVPEIQAPDRRTTTELAYFLDLPAVNVTAPERSLTLLVDTGSQFCLLRPGIVEDLGLPVTRRATLSMLGTTSKSMVTCFHAFQLGPIRCQHIPFLITPGSISQSLLGIHFSRLDGVLGMDFLKHFAVMLNFQDNTLHFSKTAPVVTANKAQTANKIHVIPLTFLRDGRPTVSVTLPGSEPLPFLLDTGSHRNIIPERLADKLGMKREGTVRLLSFGHEIKAHATTLTGVRLGEDLSLKPLVAYIVSEKHASLLNQTSGIMGIQPLKDYGVILDFIEGRLVLISI